MMKPIKFYKITSINGMKKINQKGKLAKSALNLSKNRLSCWQKKLLTTQFNLQAISIPGINREKNWYNLYFFKSYWNLLTSMILHTQT
jgi:hypothetical protein